MPKTTFAGQPLHPFLMTVPAGLLPFSFVCDVMHAATDKNSYAEAAWYSMVAGSAGAVAAGAAGAFDYFEIPSGTPVKRHANIHALMNIGLVGLYTFNLALRATKRHRCGGFLGALLSSIGTASLLVSTWYGRQMVYNEGMRVRGVSPVAGAPELKIAGDQKIERTMTDLERKIATDKGPGEPGERKIG